MSTSQTSQQRPASPQAEQYAELVGVDHSFDKQQVLQSVDLNVNAGQVLAVLGPNGAGKTTLINLLLGVYTPDAGDIHLFNQLPGKMDVRQRIGVMLQQAELADTLLVRELIRQFASYYPKPLSVEQLLQMAGLEGKANVRYSKLSGGEKRRVQFAIALAGEPDILFLDEPTTGLDVEARRTLWSSIRRYVARGAAVVLTTHYLEEADALADNIVVINHGQVVARGTPSQIKQHVTLRTIRCQTSLSHTVLEKHSLIEKLLIEKASGSTDSKQQYTLWTHSAEALLRDLLQQDDSLSDLEVSGAGLEDAFLALTKTPSRTEASA